MSEAFLPGFGPRLKAGREQKQLALAEVAAKLKLTARQVEALEEEDLSHLPSEVFVRGFVRNYARLVDVEVDSLIAPLDVQAAVAETITAPSAGVSFSTSGVRQWVILPLAALAVFLLLVAVLYHWLRKGEDTLVTESAPVVTEPAPSVPALAAPAHVQPLQPAPQATIPPDGASASPAAPPSAPAGPPPSSIPATAAGNIARPPRTGKARRAQHPPAFPGRRGLEDR
jgi:cytoskeleton protein RodZ